MSRDLSENKLNTVLQTDLAVNQLEQSVLNLDDIDYNVTNEFGHIRRLFVKSAFNQGLFDYDKVKEFYDEWRKDDEYICLRKINKFEQTNLNNVTNEMIDDYVYRFIKASKRGNDVYRYIVKQKFKQFESLENVEFFKDEFSRKKTRLLFITLTYDTKVSTAIESWYKIPILFNKFKSNLTKQYGKIKTFRVWESTDKYYAHIHCLIYFEEKEFEVFKHFDKCNNVTYRIPYYEVNKIKKYYPFNIDIQACESFQKALNEVTKYVGKYLIKDNVEDKPTKTNAMVWLTDKQGYSLSKDFFRSIIGKSIDVDEPKSADLTNYMCNSNFDIKEWEYVGLISAKELRINGKIWFVELKKPPDLLAEKINILCFKKNNKW